MTSQTHEVTVSGACGKAPAMPIKGMIAEQVSYEPGGQAKFAVQIPGADPLMVTSESTANNQDPCLSCAHVSKCPKDSSGRPVATETRFARDCPTALAWRSLEHEVARYLRDRGINVGQP